MTYTNPIVLCDYSDPDVIRVGDTYYMTASSFNFLPGLPVLASRDLVHWSLASYACREIPFARYDEVQNACGIWAPSIRFHGGKFYIFVATPDEGIFFTSAENPFGEWSALECVWKGKGFEDPCPIWDDDGRVFLVHAYVKSRIGFNSKLGLLELDPVTLLAISDDKVIFDGTKTQPTIEGPKFYKRGGFYYIFAPAGGVTDGWQAVLRSRKIDGKWEERIVLAQGSSSVNGPHQGAWVESAEENGVGIRDWFVHFQERGVFGRIVHLQPMKWTEDGWPLMGSAVMTGAECGEPVSSFEMPVPLSGNPSACEFPFRDFQFSANPKPDYARFDGKSVVLRCVPSSSSLWRMANVMTKKIDAENFDFELVADFSAMDEGSRFGVIFVGNEYKSLEVRRLGDSFGYAVVESAGGEGDEERDETEKGGTVSGTCSSAVFRVSFRKTGGRSGEACISLRCDGGFSFSTGKFSVEKGHWVGGRFGFYASSDGKSGGSHVKVRIG